MYRSLGKVILLSMLCCIILLNLGSHVYAEPTRMTLSVEKKNQLDDFFSDLSKASLEPFSCGAISDDRLIYFSLNHLIDSKYGGEFHGNISTDELNQVVGQYFDNVVTDHRNVNGWSFENGTYHKTIFAYGEMPPFSQIDELWDNGDNTLIGIVSVYDRMDGWTDGRMEGGSSWDNGRMEKGRSSIFTRGQGKIPGYYTDCSGWRSREIYFVRVFVNTVNSYL